MVGKDPEDNTKESKDETKSEKENSDVSVTEPDAPKVKKPDFSFDEALGARKILGKEGGTIEVGDCKVAVPPTALNEDVEIKLQCFYVKTTSTTGYVTPFLVCYPLGLQLNKEVEITLPVLTKNKTTYFWEVAIKETDVKKNCSIIAKKWMKKETDSIKFSITQFSGYNAVLTGNTKNPLKKVGKRDKNKTLEELLDILLVLPAQKNPVRYFMDMNEQQISINQVSLPNITSGSVETVVAKYLLPPKTKGESQSLAGKESTKFFDDLHAITTVGEAGGTFEVGGCIIIIPPNALKKDVEIEITSDCKEVDDVFRVTPLLQCKPHGLKFDKEIEIILPSFFRAEKDEISVVIRRAEDKFSDFKIIQMDWLHQETQSFKFSTNQFSWFDGILREIKKKFKVVREKVLLFGVSLNSTDVPLEMACTVVICHNKKSAKVLDKMNKAFETNFFLKCDDQELNLEITGSNIDDYQSIIQNAQCERDASSFNLRKKNEEGWLGDKVHIHLCSKSGKTLVDKDVIITKTCLEPLTSVLQIPRQQSDVAIDIHNCEFQSSTINASHTHQDGRNT